MTFTNCPRESSASRDLFWGRNITQSKQTDEQTDREMDRHPDRWIDGSQMDG